MPFKSVLSATGFTAIYVSCPVGLNGLLERECLVWKMLNFTRELIQKLTEIVRCKNAGGAAAPRPARTDC